MRKKILAFFMAVCLLFIYGCSQSVEATEIKDIGEDGIYLYYMNLDETKLIPVEYHLKNIGDIYKCINEIIERLEENPESEQCKRSIPESVNPTDFVYGENKVTLDFDIDYEELEKSSEVLCRAAVVKTLCQLAEIDTVDFIVNDSALIDGTDIVVGALDDESFVDVSNGGYSISGEVTLYYANEKGDLLKEYHETMEIGTDVSIEQSIVEELIKGPTEEGFYPTIPTGTKLIKIAVKDNICYVDLSGEFNNSMESVIDNISIYSIVNSLVELPTISKVQFNIDGKKQEMYREVISFDGMFERNLDLIEVEDKTK